MYITCIPNIPNIKILENIHVADSTMYTLRKSIYIKIQEMLQLHINGSLLSSGLVEFS